MRTLRHGFARIALSIMALSTGTLASALEIVNLGTAPTGTYSYAYGVSNNQIVVGEADFDFSPSPFRSNQGSMTNLGYLGTDYYGISTGISNNGSVIVGYSGNDTGTNAFRYVGTTMSALNPLSGDLGTQANAVSGDGNVAVGLSYTDIPGGQYRAVSWAGATPTALGQLFEGFSSEARAASLNGSRIVGYSGSANGDKPFLWTAEGGMSQLFLPQGFTAGSAEGISANGNRVVGYSLEAGSSTELPTLWDNGPFRFLERLNNDRSIASAISPDGSLILGTTGQTNNSIATIWNAETGEVSTLKSALIYRGATGISQWTTLSAATAISGNSNTGYNIAGWGVIDGAERAFLVTGVMFVPEPSTYVLAAIAAGTLFVAMKRGRKLPAAAGA